MPDVRATPITTTSTREDLGCLLCGRVAGYLQDGRRVATRPEHAAHVRRLCCPDCSGLLIAGEPYVVRRLRQHAAAECDERKGARR